MKTLVVVVAILFPGILFAQAVHSPNLYTCKGPLIDVTYTTSGKSGLPSMSYTNSIPGQSTTPIYAKGSDVKIQSTALGSLVTMITGNSPDHSSTTVTLVVPQINLTSQANLTFFTFAIETTNLSSFVGPNGVNGQVNMNIPIKVECTAAQVMF